MRPFSPPSERHLQRPRLLAARIAREMARPDRVGGDDDAVFAWRDGEGLVGWGVEGDDREAAEEYEEPFEGGLG